MLAAARSQLGVPYSYGDESPDDGFDCSGLVLWAAGRAGIGGLPRRARDQQAATTPVSDPRPGDLVFFGRPAHHVGIYIGGGRMIHAPHTGDVVRVANVGDVTNYGRIKGVPSAATTAVTQAVSTATAAVGLGLPDTAQLTSWATKGLFVVLGLALLGTGTWRAVAARK